MLFDIRRMNLVVNGFGFGHNPVSVYVALCQGSTFCIDVLTVSSTVFIYLNKKSIIQQRVNTIVIYSITLPIQTQTKILGWWHVITLHLLHQCHHLSHLCLLLPNHFLHLFDR